MRHLRGFTQEHEGGVLQELLRQYFARFGKKPCCYDDVKGYLQHVRGKAAFCKALMAMTKPITGASFFVETYIVSVLGCRTRAHM